MKKNVFAAFLICLLLPIAASADESANIFNATVLDISAQAQSKVVPDIATISAGVVTTAPSANKALQDNTKKMTGVFEALKAAGIAEKDIQTSGINVNPQYVYNNNEAPRITSYQVSDGITVVLRDIKNIGTVLDALISQGANQLSGPTFSVENQDAALDQARKEAMEKAQKRASLYAAAAGMKIKRIVSISEQGGYSNPRPYPMMQALSMAEGARAITPVAPGQVALEITVNVRYELTP